MLKSIFFKKNYRGYIQLIIDLIYAPNLFIELISQYYINLQLFPHNYTLRMVNNFRWKNKFFLKLQIINTRATFDIEISSFIVSKKILMQIDPFYLFEIGCLYKENQNFKYFRKRSKFNLILKYFFKNFLHVFVKVKEYPIRIENYQFINNNVILSLRVIAVSLDFDIPLKELIKDFTLLSNIEPGDLLRIGYSVREDEIEKNINIITE